MENTESIEELISKLKETLNDSNNPVETLMELLNGMNDNEVI